MNARTIAAVALLAAMIPNPAQAIRGGGGGWDFHGESGTHSSTGPEGTNRTTTVNQTAGGGYNRTTTAQNGQYDRTSSGGYNPSSGNFYHGSSASSPYGSQHSSTTGNTNTGNYSHSGSGNNPYGSYSNSGSGNYYNHTYNGSGTATNAWGQTYHYGTSANNGYVAHGSYVTTPYYSGYPAWGWNGGYVWAPAPYYWGGGFWGAYAIGAATTVAVATYDVQPSSPGSKLLANYKLTQVPCGPPNLVVIHGPNGSVICATPNSVIAAGNYNVNTDSLTIVSQ